MAGQKNYFAKGSIKPSFPGTKNPENPADPTSSARKSLKNLENSVTSPVSNSTAKSLENTSLSSQNSPSFYSNNIPRHIAKPSKKDKKSGFLRRFAPATLILLVIGIGFFVIFGSASFLGPHIESLFTEATDTAYTGYNLRATHMAEEMLEGKISITDYMKERLEKEGIKVSSSSSLEYNGKTITAGNFRDMYNGDTYFREAYDNAIRGRAANFFDTAAEKFYQKLGLSRDVFSNYQATGNEQTDSSSYNSLLTNYFESSANATLDTAEKQITEDDEGNQIIEYIPIGNAVSSSSSSGASSEDRAKEYLRSIGEKVAELTAGCSTFKIGNMVATAVSSNRYYQAAHEFMTKIENLSKAKAGYGDNSAANTVLNWFTTPATTTVYDPVTSEEITVTGSPLEAEGARVILGGVPANYSNTPKYSLERSYTATDNVSYGMGLDVNTCTIARAGGVVISLAALAIPGGGLVNAAIGVLLGTAFNLGVRVAAEVVLSTLVPTIARIMYENPFENAVGIAGGEGFAMGAANANMLSARQTSGASIASKEQILAYNEETDALIARDAAVDRLHHSPFDASSKNTFLGSLAHTLLPLATSTSNTFSTLTDLSTITNTSLASLSSTYAAGENSSLMTSFGDCAKTEEIGGSANFYCSAISTLDLSIIDTPTDDAEYQAVISASVDIGENGEEIVRDGSPLADFITFHMGRYSAPGIRDANIAKACKERSRTLSFLTNIKDMLKAFDTTDYCESVADGSRYVNSPDNPAWQIEKWHQLWVLTWRVKCHMGLCSEDGGPVVAYQDKYDQSHPLDNTNSGYLARISGLEKDEAETVLAVNDYIKKIENYNPNDAYAFSDHDSTKIDFKISSSHKLPNSTATLTKSLSDIIITRFQETTA
ncbi:hypothetical protein IJG78_00485 [Candidatus Saccharibacteria bacterium]|nr:hypothetical protein [Candidatus Saccharibacteria bacterium]